MLRCEKCQEQPASLVHPVRAWDRGGKGVTSWASPLAVAACPPAPRRGVTKRKTITKTTSPSVSVPSELSGAERGYNGNMISPS